MILVPCPCPTSKGQLLYWMRLGCHAPDPKTHNPRYALELNVFQGIEGNAQYICQLTGKNRLIFEIFKTLQHRHF